MSGSAQDLVRGTIPAQMDRAAAGRGPPGAEVPGLLRGPGQGQGSVLGGPVQAVAAHAPQDHRPQARATRTIAWVKGRSLAALGRTDEALKALSDPTKVKGKDKPGITIVADDPRVQLLRAQVLSDAGRDRRGAGPAQEFVKSNPESWGGHYLLGSVSEQIGDLETAQAQYAWFVDAPRDILPKWEAGAHGGTGSGGPLDSAEDVVYFGRAVDRWATLNQKYRDNNALPKVILNIFVRATEIDPDYWPAHVAAAEYYLIHDDKEQAVAAAAEPPLRRNPQDPSTSEPARPGHACRRTTSARPTRWSPAFARSTARSAGRRPAGDAQPAPPAPAALRRWSRCSGCCASQPTEHRSPGAAGRGGGAAAARRRDGEGCSPEVDQIDVSHNNASAYLEVAEQLADMWQYRPGRAKFQIAIERAPWLTEALQRPGADVHPHRRGRQGLRHAVRGPQARPVQRRHDQLHAADGHHALVRARRDAATSSWSTIPQADPIIGEYVGQYME